MMMIAVGAIMRFAVTVHAKGFNVHTAGMVLMVIGVLGALLSIGFWASWGGFGGMGRGRRGTVYTSHATSVPVAPVVTTMPAEGTIVREREIY